MAMKICKFGGSSLADGERIKRVSNIVLEKQKDGPVTVVLSAMKGITDKLLETAELAEKGKKEYQELIREIRQTHETAVSVLAEGKHADEIRKKTGELLTELDTITRGIELIHECSPRSLDLVASFGERLSCTLFTWYISSLGVEAWMLDTRDAVVTDNHYGNASVIFKPTYENLENMITGNKGTPVITGFIGRSVDGSTTTLGRNGTDYTASLAGAAIGAKQVEIWTDVDGVLSADPRLVDNAFVIPELNFQEAMELSYFGAEVIHPSTLIPAVEKDIPVYIKNTMHPDAPGTRIARQVIPHKREITGIASIGDVSLVNIEGGGMLGVPGIASRVFHALGKAGVNVIMISQASSEHSICIVIRSKEAKRATAALQEELWQEIESKMIEGFDLMKNLEIVAVIGENMRGRPGISGKLFSSLGGAGVNVLAIAQGSSERNISFVIEDRDKKRALETIHRAFLEEV
jgi:bifunctional aspartokinase / homoserine dehydrogenase 1